LERGVEYNRGVVENRSSDRASWATQEERARVIIPLPGFSAENVIGPNKKLMHEVGKPTMAKVIPILSYFAVIVPVFGEGESVGFPP
jgi:hypothetical protein